MRPRVCDPPTRLVAVAAWPKRATISWSTLVADVPGSMSYVAGNRNPSTLPCAYAGRPSADGASIAAWIAATGIPVPRLMIAGTFRIDVPSGTVNPLCTREAGSSSSASAAAPLIRARRAYVPG